MSFFYMLFDSPRHYHHNDVKRMLSDVLNWTSLKPRIRRTTCYTRNVPSGKKIYCIFWNINMISHKYFCVFKLNMLYKTVGMHAPKSPVWTYFWCFMVNYTCIRKSHCSLRFRFESKTIKKNKRQNSGCINPVIVLHV